MKVIEVCPRYHPYIGGIETHVKEISIRLAARGVEVEVYTTDPSGRLPKEEIVDGVTVKRFRSFAPNESYYISPRLYGAIKKSEYDILHAHSYHASPLLFSALARNRRKRFVATFHFCNLGFSFFRSMLHIPYSIFGRHIVKVADRIICLTEEEAVLLVRKFPSCEKKLVFIPHGVTLEKYENPRSIINGDEFKILYTGRISKEKGLDILFHAYREVQNKIRDVKLILVGDGPDRENLQRLSTELSLKNVVWVGMVPQDSISDYYGSADVFVLPSVKELQGLSVLEAMATGLPVIATQHKGLENTIFHEQNGLYFNKGDHRDLARKLLALHEDDSMCRRLSDNARTHIRKTFNFDTIILQYIRLFEELLGTNA